MKDVDTPVNQSTPQADTRDQHKARENVCERDSTGFGFTCDWMKKWRDFFKPIELF